MSSRHLLDPELAPLLELAPDATATAETLEATRAGFAEMTRMQLENADPSVTVTAHSVPGRDGAPDVGIRIYRPNDLPQGAPMNFHIHGGGYLFGTSELGDPRNREWAKQLGAAIVSIDYRLAPEHAYPAALDDCYTVLLWLHGNAASLGLDPDRIAVRGESAGGGLAAALCLLARDRGGPRIAFQLLIYPMLDDRTGAGDEANPFSGEYVWSRSSNVFGWTSLLGQPAGSPDVPYLAAPARAPDLAGLPPTLIATGALDLFVDEDLAYAARLIRAGVPTEVYVAPGAYHGFEVLAADAHISKVFSERCLDALRRGLAA